MVKINGELRDAAGKTVTAVLTELNYDLKRVAVERNGDIIPKSQYETTVIQDEDALEVVSFVGGG